RPGAITGGEAEAPGAGAAGADAGHLRCAHLLRRRGDVLGERPAGGRARGGPGTRCSAMNPSVAPLNPRVQSPRGDALNGEPRASLVPAGLRGLRAPPERAESRGAAE